MSPISKRAVVFGSREMISAVLLHEGLNLQHCGTDSPREMRWRGRSARPRTPSSPRAASRFAGPARSGGQERACWKVSRWNDHFLFLCEGCWVTEHRDDVLQEMSVTKASSVFPPSRRALLPRHADPRSVAMALA
ncbi:unnamed protein product [Lota lota]